MEEIQPGTLYIVSTPIGNLADISFRAVHILQQVDLIAAEDTRVTRRLLTHYQITTPCTAYHSYNLKRATPQLVKRLKTGETIALVSDAGTPGISDPAYSLVTAALEENITIIPVPGASALLPALVASGLPVNRFVFEGFLPQKKGRQKRLAMLASEERTLVFYESPHRIHKTAGELLQHFGNRRCVMAREITKKFETFYRTDLAGLNELLKTEKIKGEIVLIVEGFSAKKK